MTDSASDSTPPEPMNAESNDTWLDGDSIRFRPADGLTVQGEWTAAGSAARQRRRRIRAIVLAKVLGLPFIPDWMANGRF